MWTRLTQREAAVQLQVCSEEASQTAEQFPAGPSSVQLIAAVHQTVRRAAVMSFIQNTQQKFTLPNDHLNNTAHARIKALLSRTA